MGDCCSPSTCIGSTRLPESVTISFHCSATTLAVVVAAPLAVEAAGGASKLEGAMLATTSLGTILPVGTRGSTLEALMLPAPSWMRLEKPLRKIGWKAMRNHEGSSVF